MPKIYDMHSHFYENGDREIEKILETDKSLVVVAVSDDVESAMRTIEIWESYPDRVVPCIGFHPWNLREGKGLLEALEAQRLVERIGPPCIGEVGLDKRFLDPHTWHIQVEIFRGFARLASEIGAFLNIHAPDAWKHAVAIIYSEGVERAMLHWYTGPQTLIMPAARLGVRFSINAALRIQRKSVEAAKAVPLDYMVVESDGPYEYRGLKLNPLMVRETIEAIAKIKGMPMGEVLETLESNSIRLVGRI